MSRNPRPSVRTAAALLALSAIFAYGPTAQAEPAKETRATAGLELSGRITPGGGRRPRARSSSPPSPASG